MQEEDFKFFRNNRNKLFEQYPNKQLVIKDHEVKYASDSIDDALDFAMKHFELGTFIIQLCTEGEEGYTQTFHSRVIFA